MTFFETNQERCEKRADHDDDDDDDRGKSGSGSKVIQVDLQYNLCIQHYHEDLYHRLHNSI